MIVHLLDAYPKRTETFIGQELRDAIEGGEPIEIWARSRVPGTPPIGLNQPVMFFNEFSIGQKIRTLFGALIARPVCLGHIARVLIWRERWQVGRQLRAVLDGLFLAHHYRLRPPESFFAHFLYTPATTTWVAGQLLNRPFSVFTHAWDLYCGDRLKEIKLGEAREVWTCAQYNRQYLLASYPSLSPERVRLKYHACSVKPDRSLIMPPFPPIRILSVGRLVPKKGFKYLIDACKILDERRLDYVCDIIGDGPLRPNLEAHIKRCGLDARIHLRGSLSHTETLKQMQRAHIYVQPSVIAPDGDRDVIPNTLREAQCQGLPMVASRITGIPELLEQDPNARLVSPGSPVEPTGLRACWLRIRYQRQIRQARCRNKCRGHPR